MSDKPNETQANNQPVPPQPNVSYTQQPGQNYNQPQPNMQYYPPMENPGQTTGIIGLVLNFLGINLGGIILGVMSRNASKRANMSTTLGTISLVWGIIGTSLAVLGGILFIILMVIGAATSSY